MRVVRSVQVLKMVAFLIRVNDAVAFGEQWAVGFLGSNRNIRIKCNLPGQVFPQCLLKEGLVVVIW